MLSIQELQLTSNMDIMRLINNIFQVLTTENNYAISQNNMIEMQKNYNSYVSNPIINNLNNENQQKLFKTYKKNFLRFALKKICEFANL